MIMRQLVQTILECYELPWNGTHGISHWARVFENGMRLAEQTGALVEVVQLFAVFHDSRRTNEACDSGHGLRGAELAATLRGQLFDLPDEAFELLYQACAYHTDGLTEGDVTVRTCWDADRLDLARVWIMPHPKHLCTAAARHQQMIDWANRQSKERFMPSFVHADWLVGWAGLEDS